MIVRQQDLMVLVIAPSTFRAWAAKFPTSETGLPPKIKDHDRVPRARGSLAERG